MVQPAATGHVPVMAERTIDLLAPALAEGGTYVDCTLGLGGHAEAVLATCPRARLCCAAAHRWVTIFTSAARWAMPDWRLKPCSAISSYPQTAWLAPANGWNAPRPASL